MLCGGVYFVGDVLFGGVYYVEACALWRCVLCGCVCFGDVLFGGVYYVEACAMWRCVLCGGVCYVEVCTMWRCAMWRCVLCGGVCYVKVCYVEVCTTVCEMSKKTGTLVRDGWGHVIFHQSCSQCHYEVYFVIYHTRRLIDVPVMYSMLKKVVLK